MTIAFFTNFISHHQVHIADELYKLTSGEYYFIELIEMPDSYRKAGYPNFSTRPYVIQAWRDKTILNQAYKIASDVDVMLIGSNIALPFERYRCQTTSKLTFEISERWFKRGFINVLSPNFLKWYYNYLRYFKSNNVYKLCCSAFTSYDMSRIRAFNGKCFKWAYFTKVDEFDINKKQFTGTRIMWVSRFIGWKHPELPILLAKRIKELSTIPVQIDIYGSGKLHDTLVEMINTLDVNDIVKIHGNLPNDNILLEMRKHDIVLATSDKNEGWGAVVNEAMSNGCVLIGSDQTGSVPYLIKDEENGFIFKSGDIDSLFNKVMTVLGCPDKCKSIAQSAYETMLNTWSPHNAAKDLLLLIDDLQNNRELNVKNGPCSIAEIIKI